MNLEHYEKEKRIIKNMQKVSPFAVIASILFIVICFTNNKYPNLTSYLGMAIFSFIACFIFGFLYFQFESGFFNFLFLCSGVVAFTFLAYFFWIILSG